MDSVMLRALDAGHVDGPRLFARLLTQNPSPRVLRFLDGRSTPLDELRIMASAPTLPMARATVENAVGRARRRLRG
jgi:lycopene beta-cyclase